MPFTRALGNGGWRLSYSTAAPVLHVSGRPKPPSHRCYLLLTGGGATGSQVLDQRRLRRARRAYGALNLRPYRAIHTDLFDRPTTPHQVANPMKPVGKRFKTVVALDSCRWTREACRLWSISPGFHHPVTPDKRPRRLHPNGKPRVEPHSHRR